VAGLGRTLAVKRRWRCKIFFVNLDISALIEAANGSFDQAVKDQMKKAGEQLTAMTRAHIVEEANKKLHTRREMYIEGLSHFKLNDDTWVVNLDAKVRWIDDGMGAHNMLDDLLKSPKAKTAKDGSKYMVVPFRHGPKGPTQMTPAQKNLLDTIKGELKNRGINYGKTETGSDGKPKIGLLHSFDINSKPTKTHNGPGQGKGPIGSVVQGPTGIPLLQGIRIYQREVKNKDGSKSVRKDIMTFRVASSKHKGQGRWDHPGVQGVRLMDEAYDWAKRTWEREIVPQLTLAISKNF
jgi:hypothetical protein